MGQVNGGKLTGWMDEIRIYDHAISAQVAAALFSYGHAPDVVVPPTPITEATTELFLDAEYIYSLSGVVRSVNTPVKYSGNPVMSGGTWDLDVNFLNVISFGANDLRCWYGGNSYSPSFKGLCYATSTDGITWTKPNMGLVSYGGNTNNNILISPIDTDGVSYNPAGATGLKFLLIDDPALTSILKTSENGTTGYVTKKSLVASLPPNVAGAEGGFPLIRNDGRYAILNETFDDGGLRGIGLWVSDTTDPTSTWTFYGNVIPCGYAGVTAERYHCYVTKHARYWLGVVIAWNGVTYQSDLDLYTSHDEGFTWVPVKTGLVARGAGAAWDSKLLSSGSIVHVGSDWWIYYAGGDVPEYGVGAGPPFNGQMGLAKIGYERLGQVSGTGTVITRQVAFTGATLTVNADGTGGTLTVALLDSNGDVITGYADADSTSVTTDTAGTSIAWGAHTTLPASCDRIRFTLTSATLYAWTVA